MTNLEFVKLNQAFKKQSFVNELIEKLGYQISHKEAGLGNIFVFLFLRTLAHHNWDFCGQFVEFLIVKNNSYKLSVKIMRNLFPQFRF
jgi:hypothetical protein